MEIRKLAKNISKYLLLLAGIIVVMAAVFIAKDVRQPLLDSKVKTSTHLSIEQINPELSTSFGDPNACALPYIYLTLPAKCKTLNGEFVPIAGIPSNIFVFQLK